MDSNITEHFELPKTVYLPPDTEVTEDLIKALGKMKEKDAERYTMLQAYYEGKSKITERQKDRHKANNKLAQD